MTDEKREGMSEEQFLLAESLCAIHEMDPAAHQGMDDFARERCSRCLCIELLSETNRLRTELENARAQAAAGRAFQAENNRLRAENADLRSVVSRLGSENAKLKERECFGDFDTCACAFHSENEPEPLGMEEP